MNLNVQALKNLSNIPVFWVVFSLFLVTSPHLSRFPGWSIILIFVLFMWRLLCIKHKHWLPPKWLLVLISVFSFIGIFLSFGTLIGKTAGSVLLSILLAVKLHESQSQRDYMLLISLSFFIIVTNFLFSQSIPMVIFMLISITSLVISMLSINQGSAHLNLNYKLKFAVKILLQAIPLMLIMFVLFPRISGAFWQLPTEKQSALSGLSDTMSPGNISNLIQSNAVAFRVKFDNTIPQQKKLYWRAIVLWYFDGNTWEQGKKNPSPTAIFYSPSDDEVKYTVTLEPHNKNWLYALDIPYNVPNTINYTNNYNLRAQQIINNLYQYKITSVTDYYFLTKITPWEKSAGLKTPFNTNPETIQMGRKLAHLYQKKQDIINHVLQFFNQQNFHYTLSPPLTPGFNSVDQFLFDTRRGFCEHYASSFTLLMRAAGIPSRVVIGFQGGTVNPVNQIMSVRNSDAHAWSEVWLERQGWVRIDPTAAIAPNRVERNLEAALDPSESRPFHMQINSGIIKDVLFYWDAIDNQWNQWVVGYDDKFQKHLLEKIFNEKIKFSEILFLMVVSFFLILLILSLFIIKPWHRKKLDPAVKIYISFCEKLASRGVLREPHEGPLDYAKRAIDALPEHKNSITLITRLYVKLRYEISHSEKQLNQFRQHTKKFRPE